MTDNGTAVLERPDKQNTAEYVAQLVDDLLAEHGFSLTVSIIDQRSGLNVTNAMIEQFNYAPMAQIVKRD
jgi:hypothetical protein